MESTLNTGHQQIHPSDSEQLLGATISNDFTWNEHLAEMLKTLNLRINGLRKVSFAANFKCRKMLANGLNDSDAIMHFRSIECSMPWVYQ